MIPVIPNTDNFYVGLDIGTSKFKAVAGYLNIDGTLDIIGSAETEADGLINGTVLNLDKAVVGIKAVVDKLKASIGSGAEIKEVVIGISGKDIVSSYGENSDIRSTDAEITVKEVKKLAEKMWSVTPPPGTHILAIYPQKYRIDSYADVVDPVGRPGNALQGNFMLLSASFNPLQSLKRVASKAGFMHKVIQLNMVCSALSNLSEEEKEEGVVLVDIGGGVTEVVIFYQGNLVHQCTIPFAGRSITSDIKSAFNISLINAEKIKVLHGCALPELIKENIAVSVPGAFRNTADVRINVQNLSNVISARVEEILLLVDTEIMNTGLQNKLAAGIVVTGGCSDLKGIIELTEAVCGMPSRHGKPTEYLGKCHNDNVKGASYSTALGLLLSNFKSIDERENRYALASEQYDAHVSAPPISTSAKVNFSGSNALGNFIRKAVNSLIGSDLDKLN